MSHSNSNNDGLDEATLDARFDEYWKHESAKVNKALDEFFAEQNKKD